jgi:hypothetical protein
MLLVVESTICREGEEMRARKDGFTSVAQRTDLAFAISSFSFFFNPHRPSDREVDPWLQSWSQL